MDDIQTTGIRPDVNAYLRVKEKILSRDPSYIQVGPVDKRCAMFAPNIYDTNMRTAGTIKRIAGQLPYVQQSTYDALNRFVVEVAIPFLFDSDSFELMSFDEYINTKDFTVEKKENWRKYYVDHMGRLGRCEPREHDVQTHTKLEFYPEPKFYRGIYARSDRFKASYGPLIASIERVVYKLKYFIKKVPVTQRPKYLKKLFDGIPVKANDHSAFESSNCPGMMNAILRPIYSHISGLPDMVNDYMDALTGRQRIKCKDFTLSILGRRMSGEMDTSLGNALVNLICIMFVLYNKGIPLDAMTMIIEGDDSLFCTNGTNVTAMDFMNLGFSPKLESFEDSSDASFCGLVYDAEDLVNLSDPIKVLLKLGWGDAKYLEASPRVKAELYRSKLMCGLVQYYRCPVIYPYLLSEFTRIGFGKTRSLGYWYDDLLKEFTTLDITKPYTIGDRSRVKMEKIFGISVAAQERFERDIGNFKELDIMSYFDVPIRYACHGSMFVKEIFKTTRLSYRECARAMNPTAVSKQWI
jgi:hypothetical protein